jgi:hypothetical protein
MEPTKRVTYYDKETCLIHCEEWLIAEQSHRLDGPARICYYCNGNVMFEQWMKNGARHREGNEPQFVEYRSDRSMYRQEWYVDDKQHRTDGPAVIYYNRDGSVVLENWYIGGQELSKDEIMQRSARISMIDKIIND